MKKLFIGALAVLSFGAILFAADLAYTTLPQSGDSDLVIRNKQAVAIARMERGNTYTNITANGTNSVTGPVVLERLVIGTAGANSTVTLSDVTSTATNAIGTFSTTSQASLMLNVRTTGDLRAVSTSTTPANVTLSYR